MELELFWHRPVALRDGSRQSLIYVCDELDELPTTAGVYVFGRQFGENVEPIYIGKAGNLRRRVREHTERNIRLMKGIEAAKNGRRVIQVAEWFGKPGQQAGRVLPIIESALIKYALAEGYELLNVHGTKTPVHELSMSGNRAATRLFRAFMKIERR
jgi:hypothetical protein